MMLRHFSQTENWWMNTMTCSTNLSNCRCISTHICVCVTHINWNEPHKLAKKTNRIRFVRIWIWFRWNRAFVRTLYLCVWMSVHIFFFHRLIFHSFISFNSLSLDPLVQLLCIVLLHIQELNIWDNEWRNRKK